MLGGAITNLDNYRSYLKVEVPKAGQSAPIILNTGFWDMRVTTKTVEPGEKWVLRAKILRDDGTVIVDTENKIVDSNLTFSLCGVKYNKATEGYSVDKNESCHTGTLSSSQYLGEYYLSFAHTSPISEEDFRRKEIKLVITLPKEAATYYIEKIELFRAVEH
jgi:hypothetical protein